MHPSVCLTRRAQLGFTQRLRAALARAAALAALLLGASAALAQPLTLAVAQTPLSLPIYIASEKGFFTAEGLDIRLSDCTGGHRCLKQLLENRADLATASDLPIVFNAFERTDFVVLGTFVTTSEDVKLIAHARSGVSKPLHLAGKRVGVVTGASSQYFLELYLLTVGVDPRDLTLVSLQPEKMLDAISAGNVDAIAVWEPHAYLTTRALGSSAVVMPHTSGYILTFNLVGHRRLVGTREADLARVLRAVERAEQFIHDRPEDAKAILRARLKLDQAFVDWVWTGLNFRLGLEQSLITTMEGEARWARREGHVKGSASPNYLGMLHTAPLRSIKPGAVGVGR
ncbi:MAG: NrtA/SsuA/CpmA family ABC transporter substrate-binding protein [Rhizobacter sp.]|nr:NrtA/SsuA/CpmA family ABC transporter substrate-binding protein [Rhizobacter sp.]